MRYEIIMDITKNLFEKLGKAVIEYEEGEVEKISKQAIAEGADPRKAIVEGLCEGMKEVGRLFENDTYGIPEVLLCADALETGMKILKPHLKIEKEKISHKLVIGTVEGDIHSIGKDLVKLMLEVGGFDVVDLGIDVGADKFLDELQKGGADIVVLSTMITTTLLSMKNIMNKIREHYKDIKIMVGGASVTRDTADRFAADGWAENASGALKDALRISKTL